MCDLVGVEIAGAFEVLGADNAQCGKKHELDIADGPYWRVPQGPPAPAEIVRRAVRWAADVDEGDVDRLETGAAERLRSLPGASDACSPCVRGRTPAPLVVMIASAVAFGLNPRLKLFPFSRTWDHQVRHLENFATLQLEVRGLISGVEILHCDLPWNSPMSTRIKLPFGTLKIKKYRELRAVERKRGIPFISIGKIYFLWWSLSALRHRH